MGSNRKVQETYWSPQIVQMDFNLVAKLEKSPADMEVISKHFPQANEIAELNRICNYYLHKKKKEEEKPTEGLTKECLINLARAFDILQETNYPLYRLKMKIKDKDVYAVVNSIMCELEENNSVKDVFQIIAEAALEAAEIIPEKGGPGGGVPASAEQVLILDIADLYKKTHGEWPSRKIKDGNEIGPLEETLRILGRGDILGCGQLPRLLKYFYYEYKKRNKPDLC